MALENALRAALRKKGSAHKPRPHHFRADGSPEYVNRLILESSPYLLQHAHNSVDWYSWGPEAFEAARETDRPILLSVGYATCHWCHVMERASFSALIAAATWPLMTKAASTSSSTVGQSIFL